MHIVILASFYPSMLRPHTGVFFQEQAAALHHAGHQVGVIVLPRIRETLYTWRRRLPFPPSWTDETDAFPVYRMHYGWFPRVFPGVCAWLTERFGMPLYQHYVEKHGQPDVLHAHNIFYAGHLAAVIAQKAPVPTVLTEHSTNHLRGRIFLPAQKRIVRQTLHTIDHSIIVSTALQDYLTGFQPKNPVQVVGNMVDTTFFSGASPPEMSPFRLAAVGNLIPVKAFDVLIQAFAEAFKDEDVTLRIGGDGPLRDQLQSLIDQLGLSAQVTLVGRLSREGVRDLFHDSHVLVSSSQVETFGVTLIEAMACGRPAVATRSGGPQTIIDADGHNGLLVDVGDVSGLVEAMRSSRDHYTAYDAEAIRARCEARYSNAAIVAQLEAVYTNVMGS